MRIILSIAVACGWLLTGCVNSLENTIPNTNNSFKETYFPYRYIKNSGTGDSNSYSLKVAGEKGKSISNNSTVVLSDIFKSLEARCGFNKNDLLETRIVSHKHPIYYEVWIFKDKLSERKNKTSAISVVLKQFQNNGGVDIGFSGDCHSKPRNIVFGK